MKQETKQKSQTKQKQDWKKTVNAPNGKNVVVCGFYNVHFLQQAIIIITHCSAYC